jgi:hypothetical protein
MSHQRIWLFYRREWFSSCASDAHAAESVKKSVMTFLQHATTHAKLFSMTIVSLHQNNPLIDGRQSERAMLVRRGMQRHLHSLRLAVLPELSLASGRRADLITLSPNGEIWIVEIKSSIEDFKVDRKWPDYRLHCDRLFFATHKDVPLEIFPEDCGLFLSDGYDAHMIREAPEHRLTAATRKSVTLNFSRAAAQRLMLAELAAGSTPMGKPSDLQSWEE